MLKLEEQNFVKIIRTMLKLEEQCYSQTNNVKIRRTMLKLEEQY